MPLKVFSSSSQSKKLSQLIIELTVVSSRIPFRSGWWFESVAPWTSSLEVKSEISCLLSANSSKLMPCNASSAWQSFSSFSWLDEAKLSENWFIQWFKRRNKQKELLQHFYILHNFITRQWISTQTIRLFIKPNCIPFKWKINGCAILIFSSQCILKPQHRHWPKLCG